MDYCNGLMIGDNYAYVSTFYYPYYISCYGSGAVDPQDTHHCLASEYTRTCNADDTTDTDTSTGEDSTQEEDEPSGIMKFLVAFFGFIMSLIGGGE